MASFTATVDLNLTYRPSLAPWRDQAVDIRGAVKGQPLPAGAPAVVPDSLAFVIDHDLQRLVPGGITWLSSPDADELESQRLTAVRYLPDGPHPVREAV